VRTLRYTAAEALPRIIERQGYKISAVAQDLGKTRGFVSLVVRGKRTVAEEDAERIARFFRLPLDVLFVPKEKP
jgi:transcriptional regulator with XRE-family HTH domain